MKADRRHRQGYSNNGRLVYLVVENDELGYGVNNIGIFTNKELAMRCAEVDLDREIIPFRLNQEGVAK